MENNQETIQQLVTEKTVYEIILLIASDNFSTELTKKNVNQTIKFYQKAIQDEITFREEKEVLDDLDDFKLAKNWFSDSMNETKFHEMIDEILVVNNL